MFQHVVTPKLNPRKKSPCNEEPEEIEILSLAPFTPNPKLAFYEIKIGTSSTRKIWIKNPTAHNIELFVQKCPPAERCVHFNWLQHEIPAASQEMFEITWLPQTEGAWRDTIQLTDHGRIRRDIPIAFKSIKPPGPKKKKLTVPVRKLSPYKKSPKKRISQTSLSSASSSILKVSNSISMNQISPAQRRSTYNVQDKENFLSSTHPVRGTGASYTVLKKKMSPVSELRNKPSFTIETFDDSLENPQLKQKLNNLNLSEVFTPERKQLSFCCSTVDRSTEQISKLSNISSETYIKGNISGGTYVKDSNLNTSGETYVKANTSGGTYVKDGSIANLADLQLSPVQGVSGFQSNFVQNNFLSPLPAGNNELGKISEESSVELTPLKKKPVKRRQSLTPQKGKVAKKDSSSEMITPQKKRSSITPRRMSVTKLQSPQVPKINLTYEVSPSKPTRSKSPVKRLSRGYTVKSLHLKQFASNTMLKSGNLINSSAVTVTSTHNPDLFYNNVCNPYVLAQTSGVNPFIAVTMYYDPQWMDEQIARFKNWLNVLLMPPKDLNCTNLKIDVARLWQECRNKEIEKAPSKEEASRSYNQNHLLQSLRHHASKLFRSAEIIIVLSKCQGLVENKKFTMRADKDLHQDIGLQKEILRLFFCYNPLWLRIGLEQVFAMHIHLRSTSDVVGLTQFLLKNFFNNQYLLKKYKHKSAPQYGISVKKESLKKFLSLIYFLDQAKLKKLIPYDPCLFCKNAPVKESKEILLRFASELFSAIGDVTKPLKLINYNLQYKQTYIHEFEYGVESLGLDLKDGIRLTRVMEIILLEPTLTDLLRVPAISRLQKIHNVKLAFDALKRAGYTIESKIEPKDIVEGHREKTLSFLWQIIYKFQSPRFTKAVVTVQLWWRSPAVQEKLAKMKADRILRFTSAVKIQKWWRNHVLRQKIATIVPQLRRILHEIKCNNAASVIQTQYRMYKCRQRYLQIYHSTVVIQRHFRKWYKHSCLFKKRNAAAKRIQETWRTYCIRRSFLSLKQSVHVISTQYSALKAMRKCIADWKRLYSACLFIQRKYRATLRMRIIRHDYLQLQSTALVIQRKWRATLLMREKRDAYLQLQNAAIVIQRAYRAKQDMQIARLKYINLRQHVLNVQRRFRATQAMRIQRDNYLSLILVAINVQRRYRGKLQMRKCCKELLQLKRAVCIIESRYKAKKQMETCRNEFKRKVNAVRVLQTRFKAVMEGRKCLMEFARLKIAVSFIERRYKALKMMRAQQKQYNLMKNATILIQRKFRATQMMKEEKAQFAKYRNAVITIQTRYRAHLLMKKQRIKYLHLRQCTILIQSKWRATLEMQLDRAKFKIALRVIIKIQQWYRGLILMRYLRTSYQRLRNAAVCIQKRFRANLLMKQQRQSYLTLRQHIINIQRRFRANQVMKKQREEFLILRDAALHIQRRFRATRSMWPVRKEFLQKRDTALKIQIMFRGYRKMKQERLIRKQKLRSIMLMQTCVRGFLARRRFEEMNRPEVKEQRRLERQQKLAATIIQAVWRGYRVRSQESPQLKAVRLSLEAVTRRAKPEDTLRQRTNKNVLIISNEKSNVLQILTALVELEQITRFSARACMKLAKTNSCMDLYSMISKSCRSHGDTQVASAAAGVLVNLAKYKETNSYAWLPENMCSLIKIMGGYCAKELTVFGKLATLLWVFGHDAKKKEVISGMPNFAQQMGKMLVLCERQQKMVSKSYKGKNPSVLAPYTNLNLPTVTPDWGLEYPHAPHVFTNSVHGIRWLSRLFNL